MFNILNPLRRSKFKIPQTTCSISNNDRIEVNGKRFSRLSLTSRRDCITGISDDNKFFIKISLFKHDRKKNSLLDESQILKKLNQAGCLSAPTLYEVGNISSHLLRSIFNEVAFFQTSVIEEQLPYIIMAYVESAPTVRIEDIIFSVLEQKSAGVYQGDLKPSNIRSDPNKKIAVFVDYDQAVLLDETIKNSNHIDFLDWCDREEQKNYQATTWLRHYPGCKRSRLISKLFIEQAFDLAQTSLYKQQITTNTPNGVYHTINTQTLYAKGIRDLSDRKRLLDSISFENGEKVLDVGCNAGLLSMYLEDRGCQVTGGEMDAAMVRAAIMINNILKRKIRYIHLDLDKHTLPEKFDTVMLFSVLHHTKNMTENAAHIAENCKRIIIECRLYEKGNRPEGNDRTHAKWTSTSSWNFANEEDMHRGLEQLFPKFKFIKQYGKADKNRYILEFQKTDE